MNQRVLSGRARACRRLASAFAIGLLLVETLVVGIAGASSLALRSASIPSIAVSPSTGLRNDQKIDVTGKNFPKKTALVIVECSAGVLKGRSAACDSTQLVFVTTGSKGAFANSFKVLTGTVGNGKCGTTAKNMTCYLFVSEPSTTSTVKADAPITFAKSKS